MIKTSQCLKKVLIKDNNSIQGEGKGWDDKKHGLNKAIQNPPIIKDHLIVKTDNP